MKCSIWCTCKKHRKMHQSEDSPVIQTIQLRCDCDEIISSSSNSGVDIAAFLREAIEAGWSYLDPDLFESTTTSKGQVIVTIVGRCPDCIAFIIGRKRTRRLAA